MLNVQLSALKHVYTYKLEWKSHGRNSLLWSAKIFFFNWPFVVGHHHFTGESPEKLVAVPEPTSCGLRGSMGDNFPDKVDTSPAPLRRHSGSTLMDVAKPHHAPPIIPRKFSIGKRSFLGGNGSNELCLEAEAINFLSLPHPCLI